MSVNKANELLVVLPPHLLGDHLVDFLPGASLRVRRAVALASFADAFLGHLGTEQVHLHERSGTLRVPAHAIPHVTDFVERTGALIDHFKPFGYLPPVIEGPPEQPPYHREAVGWRSDGWTGEGIRVGVLDSGITATHPEFEALMADGRFAFQGFTGRPEEAPYDSDPGSHGTHVCGLIAGASYGLAPGVRLSVAALSVASDGRTTTTALLKAADWLIEVCQVDVINASIDVRNASAAQALENSLMMARQERGVLTVAAIGRDIPRRGAPSEFSRPACSPSVFSVGATDRTGRVSGNTAYEMRPELRFQPDLFAPGEYVVSAVAGGSGAKTGSSMSTPLVTGAAALVHEALRGPEKRRPGVDEIEGRLCELSESRLRVLPEYPNVPPEAGRLWLRDLYEED